MTEWNISSRCPVCDSKIHWDMDFKPIVKDWKLGDLPKEVIVKCSFYEPHELVFIVEVDFELKLDEKYYEMKKELDER